MAKETSEFEIDTTQEAVQEFTGQTKNYQTSLDRDLMERPGQEAGQEPVSGEPAEAEPDNETEVDEDRQPEDVRDSDDEEELGELEVETPESGDQRPRGSIQRGRRARRGKGRNQQQAPQFHADRDNDQAASNESHAPAENQDGETGSEASGDEPEEPDGTGETKPNYDQDLSGAVAGTPGGGEAVQQPDATGAEGDDAAGETKPNQDPYVSSAVAGTPGDGEAVQQPDATGAEVGDAAGETKPNQNQEEQNQDQAEQNQNQEELSQADRNRRNFLRQMWGTSWEAVLGAATKAQMWWQRDPEKPGKAKYGAVLGAAAVCYAAYKAPEIIDAVQGGEATAGSPVGESGGIPVNPGESAPEAAPDAAGGQAGGTLEEVAPEARARFGELAGDQVDITIPKGSNVWDQLELAVDQRADVSFERKQEIVDAMVDQMRAEYPGQDLSHVHPGDSFSVELPGGEVTADSAPGGESSSAPVDAAETAPDAASETAGGQVSETASLEATPDTGGGQAGETASLDAAPDAAEGQTSQIAAPDGTEGQTGETISAEVNGGQAEGTLGEVSPEAQARFGELAGERVDITVPEDSNVRDQLEMAVDQRTDVMDIARKQEMVDAMVDQLQTEYPSQNLDYAHTGDSFSIHLPA
jgi:hypothetical protein